MKYFKELGNLQWAYDETMHKQKLPLKVVILECGEEALVAIFTRAERKINPKF